jgi:type I restriction enzyme S subunit
MNKNKKITTLILNETNSLSSYYEKFTDGKVVCIDDVIPFDLPEGWQWCRVRDVSRSYIGLTYKPSDVSQKGTIVLRSSNIQNGKLDLNDIVRVSSDIPEKLWVEKNDIIICARNGSKRLVGKSAIIDAMNESMTFGAFMAICKTPFYKYIYLFLQSDLFFSQLREVSGTTTINQLTQNNFNRFLVPIPPVNEQERIVEFCSTLMPYIERYGIAQDQLNELNINLRPLLRKSILQEAIQGRLVEQSPDDAPASVLLERIMQEKERLIKEKKIKRDKQGSIIFRGDDNKYFEKRGKDVVCIDDEIPFNIPDSWTWCRIKDIFLINPKNNAQDDIDAAFIPMEKIDATYLSSFTYSTKKWGEIKKGFTHFADGDVAFAKITPCFQNRKSMILKGLPNGIGAGTTELKVLRSYGATIINEYLLFFLESSYFVDEATFKGTANQQRIISGYLENKLFPLPPLQEQQRIVDAVLSTWQVL